MEKNQIIEISWGTIFKVVLITLILIFLYLVREVIAVLIFSIIIASAITPFTDWIDRKKFPRLFGVLILYLAIFFLIAFVLSLIVPFMSQEFSQLSETLPKMIAKVTASLEKVQTDEGSRFFGIISDLQIFLDGISQFLQESSQSAVGFLIKVFGGIVSFIAIIIISFYLSIMKEGIDYFLSSIVPDKYENYILNLWHRSQKKLGQWFQAQILLSLIIGLFTFVGLSLLKIEFALILSVLAMILELVPTAGPVLAAIPAVALAFTQSPSLGFWVIILYIVIQQVENHILTPIIMGKSLGLNPVIVILALLMGAKIAGILGMLLSVPIATIMVEFFNDLAEKKTKIKSS